MTKEDWDLIEKYPDIDLDKIVEIQRKEREFIESEYGRNLQRIGELILFLSKRRKVYRRGFVVNIKEHQMNRMLRGISPQKAKEIINVIEDNSIYTHRVERVEIEFSSLFFLENLHFVLVREA